MSARTCGSLSSTSATTFSSLWKGIGIVGVFALYSIMMRLPMSSPAHFTQ